MLISVISINASMIKFRTISGLQRPTRTKYSLNHNVKSAPYVLTGDSERKMKKINFAISAMAGALMLLGMNTADAADADMTGANSWA